MIHLKRLQQNQQDPNNPLKHVRWLETVDKKGRVPFCLPRLFAQNSRQTSTVQNFTTPLLDSGAYDDAVSLIQLAVDRECFLGHEGQLVSEKFMATIRFDRVGNSGRQIRLSFKSAAQFFTTENEAEPKKIDMKPVERSWDISLKQVRESKSYGPMHFKRAQYVRIESKKPATLFFISANDWHVDGWLVVWVHHCRGLELFKQLNHYQLVFLLNKADQSKTQMFATAVAKKDEMKNYISVSCTFPKENLQKASEKGGSNPEKQKNKRMRKSSKKDSKSNGSSKL